MSAVIHKVLMQNQNWSAPIHGSFAVVLTSKHFLAAVTRRAASLTRGRVWRRGWRWPVGSSCLLSPGSPCSDCHRLSRLRWCPALEQIADRTGRRGLCAAAPSQSAGAQMAQESWKGKWDSSISFTVGCLSVANYGFWVRVYIFLIMWPESSQWLRSWKSHEKRFTAFEFLKFRLRIGIFYTDSAAKQCTTVKVALRQHILIQVKK